MPNNYLIGRQPILNCYDEVVAYELLFRSASSHGHAAFTDASHATASVIVNTLTGFGLDAILGRHKGFINMDLELLMSDAFEILPKDRVVLELLETLRPTPDIIERCRLLKAEGFSIALDDHEYDPLYRELYEIVDIVKVDLFQTSAEQMAVMLECLRPYQIRFLAEKVETRDEHRQCLDMGFELFQGYYFAKPSVMEKKGIDQSTAALLKLMHLLMEDAEVDLIEQVFRGSPGLTYKLLLLVNSVSTGMRQRIRAVRHAIAILGRRQIQRWVQLALFAADDARGLENPLVDMAAVRAGFMEQLARRHPLLRGDREAADQAFMVGILSLLETIYSISMDEVVTSLGLTGDVKMALVGRGGIFGELLDLTILVEQMEFKSATDRSLEMGLSLQDVLEAQVASYDWRAGMV